MKYEDKNAFNRCSDMVYYHGFTLIELIVVILLLGILSATVIPRIDFGTFRQAGGFQQGVAMMRYGQKLAINTGCQVRVDFNMTDCNLRFVACPGVVTINDPSTNNANFCPRSTPNVNPAVNFTFNIRGEPVGGQQNFTLSGQVVNIEANTGYVR